jgi:Uma2 family endonuclease
MVLSTHPSIPETRPTQSGSTVAPSSEPVLPMDNLLVNIPSLEVWLTTPLDHTEWVNGELVEKAGMTLKHGRIQARLGTAWTDFKDDQNLGGEVYTDVPCRTRQQGRRPDVAYLTPQLQAQYGNGSSLPQSFPLIAEIVSPIDQAEAVILKAEEYLASGAIEVWFIYPESHWVIVATATQKQIFTTGQNATTQSVLVGFTIAVDALVA